MLNVNGTGSKMQRKALVQKVFSSKMSLSETFIVLLGTVMFLMSFIEALQRLTLLGLAGRWKRRYSRPVLTDTTT